ncbi:nucleoside hydrolase [Arthrobacter gengyunqii]|uniref:Nucleoside hydrolase n=1 Tax=Arthrobacter gengyunqii TaxID=2886940 RepID=A0ABS8GKH2_9MICC|nr:nucleoside hydrolase [Arthrobacter gengyunqii]MCC3266848.1 nucleoside hydrolase [Arthrobacter gengyunqii]
MNPAPAKAALPAAVIADVDTGMDDALALVFLARDPRIDLLAVTCVAGNTAVDQVVRNTLDVLHAAGAGGIPVARGAERPLINDPRDAHAFHGANGLGGLDLPRSPHSPGALAAVELMHRTIEDSPVPVTLLALGPLTNVAVFLRAYPATARKLERIVFMGGSAGIGNATSHAEFNAWQDPEALAIVIHSGVPTVMYGLDVFIQATLEPAQYLPLVRADDDGARLVGDILTVGGLRGGGADPQPVTIGDAGAACLIAVPQTVELLRYPVRVELSGHSRGQTLVDRRLQPGESEHHGEAGPVPVIEVALGLDHRLMTETFLNTVLPGPSPR